MSDSERNIRGRGRGGPRGRGNNNFRFNRWRGRRRGQISEGSSGNPPTASASNNGQRQNHINEMFTTVSSPLQGWSHYFPSEDFTPACRIYQNVKHLMDFFQKNTDRFDFENIKEKEAFPVDHQSITSDEHLLKVWPQFSGDLYDNPANTLACLSLAMHQLLVDHASQNELDNSSEDDNEGMNSRVQDVPFVRARLTNYKTITPMKNLRAGLYGKLVAINGTVVRASNSKPLCLFLAFQCRTCKGILVHSQKDGQYELPVRCSLERNNMQCTGMQFEPLRNSSRNVVVEWQSIRIQENNAGNFEIGRIPRSVDVELMEDLVDSCSPGEIVTLIGIVKVINVNDSDRRSKEKNMFTHYIDAVAIHNRDRGNSSSADPGDTTASTTQSTGLLTFNIKDYYAIQKIHAEPQLFAFLVASLCPSIYGNELVKAGLLLSLMGGSNPKHDHDRTNWQFTKRPDIHILIVGDPGLGKSQMLHACSMVAPRGVYVCGNSTTNSGLTVTLTKDSKTNGNEYTLEAGALVLADQGSCCIDEFDKMSGQHQALLEAMEQQSISLAKAGVVCSLPARTSVLAAANPIGGHYNRAKTVSENIKLGPALLSRFDLVFLLLDRPDLGIDTMLTEHIMALHTGKKSGFGFKNSSINSSMNVPEDTLKSRLRLECSEVDFLPAQLLRKYIAYAREYVHPLLNEEAKKEINDFYLHLRQSQYSNDSTPITPRQLESLVRLAQARAKAELREEVTAQDARDVIELVRTSFDDVFRNEAGGLDFTRSQNGSGMSSRNEGKKFIQVLQRHSDSTMKTLFNKEELRELASRAGIAQGRNFNQFIDNLNNQGYLLNRGSNLFKLVVN